jgi:succinate dehydrogenase / fumarate reductase iron-sulfur subunit/fumarate reductase iron-sulfur subunit
LSARADSDTVHVRVHRSDPDAPRWFTVDRIEPMTVLDALLAVQREHDATIGFRFSCRVAMCGTCTVRVNGRSALACQTPVPRDGRDLRVDPVAGLPVIRDLLVDTRPFWDEWARVTPYMVPREDLREPAVVPPDSEERRTIDPALDCIGCGACWSSCGVADDRRDFLGPAALNRAMVLIADSRDAAGEERLATVAAADGVDRCHYVYGCTAACPKGLDPAGSIRRLRAWRLHDRS